MNISDSVAHSMEKKLHKLLHVYIEKHLSSKEKWKICTEADGYTVFAPCDWPQAQSSTIVTPPAERDSASEANDEGWYLCYIPVPLLAYYAVTGPVFLNGVGHCWTPSVTSSLTIVFRLHHALCAGSGKQYEELVFDFYQSTPSLEKSGFILSPDAGGNIVMEVQIDWNILLRGEQYFEDALAPLGNSLTELFNVHDYFNNFVSLYSDNIIKRASHGPSVETAIYYMNELMDKTD
ncbi:hypothetical protein LJC15_01345 [Desulfovibrio sp. OttesenSCG-928-G11]|nr:hypothetical protein [Desulfovibrio sp. OttesenSCG-928-G11]